MPLSDFRVVESLGKGSFASVYKVMRKSDNKVYALKRVKIGKMSKREIADALNEIRFLASIRHKNIVGFLESFLENNESELCIVMEYCGCGDLAQKVERYKRRRQYMEEDVIWRYLIQFLKSLKYLHEKGICHRDIKAANTFIAEDGSIKVGDMNVSKTLNKGNLKTQIGTPYYMSPEIWHNRPYDFSSDIWSLGCLIYELCALQPPFTGDSFPALKRAVTNGRYAALPSKYSAAMTRAVANMLRLSPQSRLSAEDMLRSPEVAPKLHLDGLDDASDAILISHRENFPNLLQTIRVPQNLRKLNGALPKPCYPDVRPNTPEAWVLSEQYKKANEVQKSQQPQTQQRSQSNRRGDRRARETIPEEDEVTVDKDSHSVDSRQENRDPSKDKDRKPRKPISRVSSQAEVKQPTTAANGGGRLHRQASAPVHVPTAPSAPPGDRARPTHVAGYSKAKPTRLW